MSKDGQMFISNGTGKLGQVILSSWKGKSVYKAYQPNVNQPNTLAQKKVRNGITVVSKLAKQLRDAVMEGLKISAGSEQTEYSKFVQLNYGVVSVDDNLTSLIDWAAVVVSKGTLSGIRTGATATESNGVITFSLGDMQSGEGSGTDKLCIAVVSETLKKGLVRMDAAQRGDNVASIILPVGVVGKVHCYLYYYNAITHAVSDNAYITVNI